MTNSFLLVTTNINILVVIFVFYVNNNSQYRKYQID